MSGYQTIVVQKLTANNNNSKQIQQVANSKNVYMLGSDLVSLNLFDVNGKLYKHKNQKEFFSITFNVKVG